VPSGTVVLNALPCDKKIAAAFWCVNQEKEPKKVNVELQGQPVNYLMPSSMKPSRKKTQELQIPCYVNCNDIEPDDEILVLKADADKTVVDKRIGVAFEKGSGSVSKKNKIS
jgi:hypothetical protein